MYHVRGTLVCFEHTTSELLQIAVSGVASYGCQPTSSEGGKDTDVLQFKIHRCITQAKTSIHIVHL